jgi:hypothetical protein
LPAVLFYQEAAAMAHPFVQPDETKRAYHSGRTGRIIQQHVATVVFDPVDYATYSLEGFEAVARSTPMALNDEVRSVSFETGKYVPPFTVTLRTSVDWNRDVAGVFDKGQWLFELPGNEYEREIELKFMLDGVFWMIGDNVKVPQDQRHRHFMDGEVFFAYDVSFVTSKWRPNHLVTLRNSDDGWGRDLFGVFVNGRWRFLLDRAIYPDDFEAKFVLGRSKFMTGRNIHLTKTNWLYERDDAKIQFASNDLTYQHGYDNFLPIESPLEQSTVRAAGDEDEYYDVVIIGSGMGGGTLADALSDRGAKVLVLEAGGLWMPVHMNELPSNEIDLARRDELGHYYNAEGSGLIYGVHFNLGGRSTYWSGLIPRIRPWEMRGVWPTTVKDYLFNSVAEGLCGYDRAEQLMRKGKTLGPFQIQMRNYLAAEFTGEFEVIDLPRSLHQPNLSNAGQIENVLQKPTGVFSTVDLLLDSLGFSGRAGRTSLRINLHQLAVEIEKDAAGKPTAILCQDLIGNVQRRYRGKYFVMACGSIESAKLAINSNLADDSGKLGKGLTDHPTFFYNIHHVLPRTGPMAWIGDLQGHAKILMLHQGATPTAHAYNVELLINPKYWDARHADDDLWAQLIDSQQDSRVEMQFKFSSALDEGNYVQPKGAGNKPEVMVAPNHTGSPFKAEVVDVRNRILDALGVTDYSSTWIDDEWAEGTGGTPHHAGGTLRMHADPSKGVVDDTLKLHKYDNLYCCDVSVFPSIPAANPSLTLVALAQRLADTLAGKLGL